MFKFILVCVGLVLIVVAGLATPIAAVYGLHEWAVVDVQLKVALWEAAKVWISMLCCAIPGGVLIFIGAD